MSINIWNLLSASLIKNLMLSRTMCKIRKLSIFEFINILLITHANFNKTECSLYKK